MKGNIELLNKYLPENTSKIVADWILKYGIHLRITGNRVTKHGDYYPPVLNTYHKITINHNLNRYAFLITFLHEMAHLLVWMKYKNRVKPHGNEWKLEFRNLMEPFFSLDVFPADINDALVKYLQNAKASTSSDTVLSRILVRYDINNDKILLENLPDQAVFSLRNGKVFVKGEKLRKRYRCTCLVNSRVYLINPLVEVFPAK